MSNRELRLRYQIELASNIGAKARQEAAVFEESNRRMEQALKTTERGVGQLDRRLTELASGNVLERQVGYINAMARGLETAKRSAEATYNFLSRSARIGASAFAGVAGAVYTADRITRAPIDFDLRLRQAALTAYGDKGPHGVRMGMDGMRGAVNQAVRRHGGSRDQALDGYQFMAGTGQFTPAQTLALLPVVQEAAVGTATDVKDLAALSMRMKSVMGVEVSRMRVTLSRLAKVGQLGGVELDQQAGFIADLSGNYPGLGYTGERGAVAAAVDLQLAFQSAGSADSARTILDNFYGKTLSADTARDFRKIKGKDGRGIDLFDEIAKRRAQGMDGVESFLSLTDEVLANSGGDQKVRAVLSGANFKDPKQADAAAEAIKAVFERAGIGSFMQDKEAMRGFMSLSSQREQRRSMISTAMADSGQTLDTISTIIQESTAIQQQKALAEASIATELALSKVTPALNDLLQGTTALAQEFPGMAAALAGLTGAATIASAALGAVGLMSLTGGLPRGGKPALGVPPGVPKYSGPPSLKGGGLSLGLTGVFALLGAGIESYDVVTDDSLTTAGKTRGLAGAGAGALGVWGGAGVGAALGTAIAPGPGTLIGGLAGGALGYIGGKSALDMLWSPQPERDLVRLTDPRGASLGSAQAGAETTVQIGEGRLQVDVRLTDDRASVTSLVTQPMPLLRLDAGSTDPGSFNAGLQRGGF